MLNRFCKIRPIIEYNQGRYSPKDDKLVIEVPLTIFLNGEDIATLLCSPADWQELVAGYLWTSGVIHGAGDIKKMAFEYEQGLCYVETEKPLPETYRKRQVEDFSTPIFLQSELKLDRVNPEVRFTAEEVLELARQLDEQAVTFRETGAAHSVALGDHSGILARFEDVGRHNALDKVLGWVLLNGVAVADKCVVLSGRVAADMLLKAAHANIPLVISRAAPTELALRIADELGIGVVGFARGARLNIYNQASRLIVGAREG